MLGGQLGPAESESITHENASFLSGSKVGLNSKLTGAKAEGLVNNKQVGHSVSAKVMPDRQKNLSRLSQSLKV